jgi:CheY-like chemotaxis protein
METPLKVLVAEDDLADIHLLQRAFAKAGMGMPVYFAPDGEQVLAYLQGKPPFDNPVDYPLPTLLLLDLNLPQLSGFEVLQWLRAQPGLRCMIVVVFSASDRPEDIRRAYALGAHSYVVKPQEPDELARVVQRLQDCWRGINAGQSENSEPNAMLALT